jgi:hypothetical protein
MMVTALQGAKIRAAMQLMDVSERLRDCKYMICMGVPERKALEKAQAAIDQVLATVIPSNDGPDRSEKAGADK